MPTIGDITLFEDRTQPTDMHMIHAIVHVLQQGSMYSSKSYVY